MRKPYKRRVGKTYAEERERQIKAGDITPEQEGISIGAMFLAIQKEKNAKHRKNGK